MKKQKRKRFPLVTFILALLILMTFLLETFFLSPFDFSASPNHLFTRPWTVFLSIFFHAPFPQVSHISLNLLGIIIFGSYLERRIGNLRFLALFLISGIAGNLIQAIFCNSQVLGASATIYGMIAFISIFSPFLRIKNPFIAALLMTLAFFWIFLELFGAVFLTGIAHLSHLTGFVLGIVFGCWFRKSRSS